MPRLTLFACLLRLLLVVGGWSAFGPTSALARPIDQAREDAKTYFRAGVLAYKAGNFEAAIQQYQLAMQKLPLPEFMFNLGQAYRAKGDLANAIASYRAFVVAAGVGPAVDEARGYIVDLEREAKARARAEAERAVHEERAARPEPKPVVRAEVRLDPPPAAPVVVAVTPRSAPKPLVKKPWFWVTIGAAAIVVGAGVTVGVLFGTKEIRYPEQTLGTIDATPP